MKLLIPISLNCLFVVLFYLLEKQTKFAKLPFKYKQVIIGLVFGCLSAFASEYGVAVVNTIANVRDAAPLCAGLIFGGPAGIISGFLGGLYRWFSVYWGAGEVTRVACTIATIFVGFVAAGLRKYMFDNKKPTWGYGVFISVICEVIHMLLIFLTNMSDGAKAFDFVKEATLPMVIGNSIAVGVSLVVVSLLSREGLRHDKDNKGISQTFQRWLLVLIVVAYLLTTTFTYFLQDGIAEIETRETFTSAINDVVKDVRGKSDESILKITNNIKSEYERDNNISLKKLAEKYNVTEINIVDSDGIITKSTEKAYANKFNMNSTEQSKEFMVLVDEKDEFVQGYGPMGRDQTIMRKYAGSSFGDGTFIQVGYDSAQFHYIVNDFVVAVTKNRHVGSTGFVAVCDEQFNMITHDEWNGKHISEIGIKPEEEMSQGKSASRLYETNIVNEKNSYNEEYIYAFTFVEGYCIIATMPKAEAMLMRDTSMYSSMFMQILIFAALFVFLYFLIKKVIINNLRKVNGTLSQITEGNLNVTVDVRSTAEFSSLSDDINSTVTTLKRYISEAAARIDKELEYAKQIQLSAMPTNFPDNEKYGIYAQMIAAKEVGGDFYDFYKLDDNTVAILIADVSGKGIPAAMFMMTAKTIIKDLAERGLEVNEIFSLANEKLCENNDSGMFVTAWMGLLDLSTGNLKFANAGHNPPLVAKKNGSFEYLKTRPGFILAGMEGVNYRLQETTLLPGERIFLYTDGVTEATDTKGELYGEDRLSAYMNKNISADAEALLCNLKSDIDTFVGEAPQFDDITMLVFDYKDSSKPTLEEKQFPAMSDALGDVLGYVEEKLESFGCSMRVSTAICVAIEEVFVNVASYAYGEDSGDVTLGIGYNEATGDLTLVLKDSGVPFDPLKKSDPDVTLSADDREIGGLGIFITKKTMDNISYTYKGNENILTMIKNIKVN